MNPALERRYLELFWAYDAGGNGLVQWVKHRLMAGMSEYQLRADAALCLLALYDNMIVKPYYGVIPERSNFPQSGDLSIVKPAPDRGAIEASIEVIFERIRLGDFERPVSSHSALLAIQQAWPRVSELFLWG
jgi:hypothetical protein